MFSVSLRATLAALTLAAAPAAAQPAPQWIFAPAEPGQDAALLFGIPNSGTIAMLLSCNKEAQKANFFMPLAAGKEGEAATVLLSAGAATAKINGKTVQEAAIIGLGTEAREIEAKPIVDVLRAAVNDSNGLTFKLGTRTATLPVKEKAPVEAFISACSTGTDS